MKNINMGNCGRNIEDLIHNTRDLDGVSDKKSTRFCVMEKCRINPYWRNPSPWEKDSPVGI